MKLMSLTASTLAALSLAACGEGGASRDGARNDQPDDQAQLAFSRCMREAGIDFPDPVAGGSGPGRVQIGEGTPPQKLRDATERCRKRTGGGPRPLTEEQQAEFRDAALKFARCMRAHGVDIPDPTTSGEGAVIRMEPGSERAADMRSPAFQRAQAFCARHMPRASSGGSFEAPGS
jgi:hypothetical protein